MLETHTSGKTLPVGWKKEGVKVAGNESSWVGLKRSTFLPLHLLFWSDGNLAFMPV